MNFLKGFDKVAIDWGAVAGKAGKALSEAKTLGGAALKGAKTSGGSTVSDALKLKGLGHIGKAVERAGGFNQAFGTAEGRKAVAEGVGRAAPSLAAGGAYAYGLKKLYDKTLSGAGSDQSQYYGG